MSQSIAACWVAPDVPTRRCKTTRRDNPARLEYRRLLRENMKERGFVRDILNLNVVSNDVTLQPCAKRFAKLRFGVDQQTFPELNDKDVRIQLAFCIEHAGFHGDGFTRLAQIVCDLPV